MAKDDFHVIAYRILKYLYNCIKTGTLPDTEMLSAKYLEINESYFEYIIITLLDNGYIKGVARVNAIGRDVSGVKITNNIQITLAGIEYLTENSTIEKAKRFLKDVKDIIPAL